MNQYIFIRQTLSFLAASLVCGVTTLVFFNSTLGDTPPSEKFDFSNETVRKIAFLSLAFLIGLNEFFELLDHIKDHRHHHPEHHKITSTAHGDTKPPNYQTLRDGEWIASITPDATTLHRCKMLAKGGLTAMMTPLLLAALYGLFTQSTALMTAFTPPDSWENRVLAILCTAIFSIQFMAVPVAHTMRNIWGGHREFTAKVIGSEEIPRTSRGVRALIFIVVCSAHLTESFLLTNAEKILWLRILSVIGLVLSRSASHLNHASALFTTYRQWRTYSPVGQITSTVGSTVIGGIHAVPSILGAIHFWDKTPLSIKSAMAITTLIGALLGALEHMQHGARYYATTFSAASV
ncbi:MAG: hypothetical protein A3F17_07445 [Gammaproteobacteria bacterium RIFCSPHIGHO2_12_FULL_41_15]|nr:MAG: hypothetical protein A3F17_07445 [Gammaproteobacteria bacterium RIFCSPHIGHO2_12_FULL_41_15]